MSWGTELWDRYDAMCTYTSSGVDFLDNSVARFMKERSIIETEYAKKLRKLVKDFSPKDMPSEGGGSANTLKVDYGSRRRSFIHKSICPYFMFIKSQFHLSILCVQPYGWTF